MFQGLKIEYWPFVAFIDSKGQIRIVYSVLWYAKAFPYQFGWATISSFRDHSNIPDSRTNRNQLVNIYLMIYYFHIIRLYSIEFSFHCKLCYIFSCNSPSGIDVIHYLPLSFLETEKHYVRAFLFPSFEFLMCTDPHFCLRTIRGPLLQSMNHNLQQFLSKLFYWPSMSSPRKLGA